MTRDEIRRLETTLRVLQSNGKHNRYARQPALVGDAIGIEPGVSFAVWQSELRDDIACFMRSVFNFDELRAAAERLLSTA